MANVVKVHSEVIDLKQYGEGVYLVTFAVPARSTRFIPGQFLHLTLDEFDPTTGYWPESRVFSIASKPREEYVTIIYSVKGPYTRRMEQVLRPGCKVWLKLPYGDFIISEKAGEDEPVVLIAGGTGVSPFIPYLLSDDKKPDPVHLFYGIRKTAHLLFRDELLELTGAPWLNIHLFNEEELVLDLPAQQGRLSVELIAGALGPTFQSSNFFLSGPPDMITTFSRQLAEHGIEERKIHIDEWS